MSPPPESPFRRGVRYFFEAAHNAESMQKMSVEIPVPDKHGYILGDEFLPSRQHTPLLVFVNSRSGPQQGQLLITQLERLLNPIQIWDLANGGPEPVLESFCVFTRLRILVCGGDGSVSWIVGALERLNLSRKWPPIAILPLGTGNDLARVMGWGGGYNNESLIGILEQVSESYTSLLDRWEMTIEDSNKKTKEVKTFFNYLGVGADAEAALQVHYLRESRPDWFFSRLVNKAWYGVFGAEDILKNTNTVLRKDIVLYADGVEVPLPNDSQGIIILNIDSYAGGIPIWAHGWKPTRQPPLENVRRSASLHELRSSGFPLRRSNSAGDCLDSSDDLLGLLTDEERYERVTTSDMPTSCQDGMLEVVSIRSLFHLGQIRVGLSNAQRVCQCRHVKIVTRKKVAFQIDGEPWRQDECVLQIRRKADPVVMLHRSADDGAETEVSKLLEWAEERQLIDGTAHGILRKEFSRRIESKMRRRQSAASNTVLHNLSRAIGSSGALQHQNHQSSGTSNLSPGVNGQSRSNAPSQPYKYGWHGGIAF
jgi:diacylglycerol kinase (ATP)